MPIMRSSGATACLSRTVAGTAVQERDPPFGAVSMLIDDDRMRHADQVDLTRLGCLGGALEQFESEPR